MAINSSFITFAKVMHKRLTPRVNQFVYEVFYICFDISKINNLSKKIFSLNKFNLFSFYEKDYGPKDGSSIENWAWNILKNHQIDKNINKIFFLFFKVFLDFGKLRKVMPYAGLFISEKIQKGRQRPVIYCTFFL